MSFSKKEVIRLLETIALYMELLGENSFKIQAFRKAALQLQRDERQLEEIADLSSLPNIGKGIAAVIDEFLATGESKLFNQLKNEVPQGLIPLLQIPGLGSKTIAKLHRELNINNIDDLEKACLSGKIEQLPGFGQKKQENILSAIRNFKDQPIRIPLADCLPIAEWIEEQIANIPEIEYFSRAGSLRRIKETLKDLDFIIATKNPASVIEQIVNLPNIKEIKAKGNTKVSCIFSFQWDLSVDFRLVQPEEYYCALHHFTGSKEHNVAIRQLAKERNEKVNEYGIENIKTGERILFQSEEEFFHHFHLPYLSPELREDGTEIERANEIFDLVSLDDIKGDMHMHTTWSDGGNRIEEMVEKARTLGYEYIAITDHSQFLKVANGLTKERLFQQKEFIQRLQEKYSDIRILAGIEMDILPDGTLDFDSDVLQEMDFVIASIHSGFQQNQEQIMERLKTALYNKYVHMIAHPTGRVIGRRDGYDVNIDMLIQLAKETDTILELNASPKRLDLAIDYLKKAQNAGVKIAINTDSHHQDSLDHMKIGVQYARKAWLKKKTIINTLPLKDLLTQLHKKRSSRY